ncbi:hypothetical protein RUM44_009830 [Polyplax serrata]|uniref:Uncharacterized protein n=1 Tax=Polyplax serrata TaxID=468196 RepID=A0ABR1AVA4_POLSC
MVTVAIILIIIIVDTTKKPNKMHGWLYLNLANEEKVWPENEHLTRPGDNNNFILSGSISLIEKSKQTGKITGPELHDGTVRREYSTTKTEHQHHTLASLLLSGVLDDRHISHTDELLNSSPRQTSTKQNILTGVSELREQQLHGKYAKRGSGWSEGGWVEDDDDDDDDDDEDGRVEELKTHIQKAISIPKETMDDGLGTRLVIISMILALNGVDPRGSDRVQLLKFVPYAES